MRILDGLVARTYLKIFLAFILGAPVLFVIGDITERLDNYIDRGLGLGEVAMGYVYLYPKFVLWAFPVASLVAAVFTVQSMTVNREIMAAKAGGISFHRTVAPMILMGAVLMGIALWLNEVVPHTNRQASEILLNRDSRRDWRANFVFQGEDDLSIAVQRLTVSDGRMQDVALEKPAYVDEGPEFHMFANEGRFDQEEGWTFQDGYLRQLYPDGRESTFQFEGYRTRSFTPRPFELLEEPLDDEEMTYAEMGRMVDIILRSGGDPMEYLVKREQKLAIPVMTLVVILFGAPLATTSKRGGPAFGIGLALGSVVFYMLLFKTMGAFGQAGNLSPFLAAWLPNTIFVVTGLGLLAKVRT
jgi:lipopolysaccharide export system permease protein